MPICIEATTIYDYLTWLNSTLLLPFYRGNKNNILDIKYVYVKEFHSSISLNSNRNEELKIVSVVDGTDKSIELEAVGLQEGLSQFKEAIKNIKKEEVETETSNIQNYLDNHETSFSSIEEAFPNYVTQEGFTELTEDELNGGKFEIISKLYKLLEECKAKGLSKECLERIKINKILEDVESNDISEGIEGPIISSIREQVLNLDSLKQQISDITLGQIYDKITELKEKINIKVSPNITEIGFNLVSYGLLLKTYNKYVHDRPFPKELVGLDLIVANRVRHFTRFWFAGVMAPLLLFGFHGIRAQRSLVNVEITPINNDKSDNSTINKSLWGVLLFLQTKKNKQNLFILLLTLIITLIFFMFIVYNFGLFNLNFKSIALAFATYQSYIKIILLFAIFIPILINVIILFLLAIIEWKGNVKYLTESKIIPNIFKRFINYLLKIVNNKELLTYYKNRGFAEISLYVVILLFVLIIF